MTDGAADNLAAPARPARGWLALLLLIAIGASVHAWLAARTKAPTYDEPVHALSSWLIVNASDFRVNPEHPPLWKYVAGLGMLGMPLSVDRASPTALAIFSTLEQQWGWTIRTLFPENDPAGCASGLELIARGRTCMAIFAFLFAIIVGRWAWVWGGPVAANVAALLVALDPTIIAHAGLITNDVAAACLITLATFLTWRVGERATRKHVGLLLLVIGAALGTKFTALLLAPMLGLPLLYRALTTTAWPIGTATQVLRSRLARVAAVLVLGLLAAITWVAAMWPLYQFQRYPAPEGLKFSTAYPRLLYTYYAVSVEHGRDALDESTPKAAALLQQRMRAVQVGLLTKTFFRIGNARIFPQPYTFGIDYANARSLARWTYLLGESDVVGHASYFPVAVAVKTPLTTLALLLGGLVVGTAMVWKQRRDLGGAARWKLICLLVPPAIYFAVAMASSLNIGIRHVIPVFGPAYVAVGVLAARLVARHRAARVIVPLGIAVLAVETLSVFPNYINFFNVAAGGARGGVELLGDSNLDWGQDLNALGDWYRQWRPANPRTPFYLAYFGSMDPHAYGIRYINAAPGYAMTDLPIVSEVNRGVLAISATFLQGTVCPEEMLPVMKQLRQRTPMASINGTINLYEIDHLDLFPMPPSSQPSSGSTGTTQPTP